MLMAQDYSRMEFDAHKEAEKVDFNRQALCLNPLDKSDHPSKISMIEVSQNN